MLETETNESNELDRETSTYLAEIEKHLYDVAKTRDKIDGGLLFIGCQFSSVSMAWCLYSLQVSLVPVCVLASSFAIVPGLIDISESFGFFMNSERWELINYKQKPLIGFVKLGLGIISSYCGTTKIVALEANSKSQIETAYSQIQQPAFNISIPADWSLLVVVILMIGGMYVKFKMFGGNRNEKV